MKRILLATVALAALAAPAAAADLSVRYPVKAVPVPVQVFSWTGFYIGANAGYGGNNVNQDASVFDSNTFFQGSPSVYVPLSGSQTIAGFFAGGQIGYNYQFANNVVVGLETDIQWSDISGSDNNFAQDLGWPFGQVAGSYNTKVEWFGTIRARLGYAFDRFLPYITGGAAYGSVKSSFAGSFNPYGPSFGNPTLAWADNSGTNWGWTIGGGFEYAITNNWTVKTEYLYVDLGSNDVYNAPIGFLDNAYLSSDAKFHTVKAGVNYKF